MKLDLYAFFSEAFSNRLAQATLDELTSSVDGSLWFIEYLGLEVRLGHMYPDGTFVEHRIKDAQSLAALTPRPDGSLWFIKNGELIERLGSDGAIRTIAADSSDTLSQLVFSSDGSMWLTAMGSSSVTHVSADGRRQRTFKLPPVDSSGENARLAVSGDGTVWYTSYGGNRILRFSADESLKEVELPWNCGPFGMHDLGAYRVFSCWHGSKGAGVVDPSGAGPRPVDIRGNSDTSVSFPATLDGRLWFIDRGDRKLIGLGDALTIRTLQAKESSSAYELVASGGKLWFLDGAHQQAVSVDTKTGSVASYAVPQAPRDGTGLPSIDALVSDKIGNVWFIVRHDMSLYRLDQAGMLKRFAIHPGPVMGLR